MQLAHTLKHRRGTAVYDLKQLPRRSHPRPSAALSLGKLALPPFSDRGSRIGPLHLKHSANASVKGTNRSLRCCAVCKIEEGALKAREPHSSSLHDVCLGELR